jgi:hypothetical protein
MSGRMILIKEMAGAETKLDISMLPAGIHILQLFEAQVPKGSLKIIKQ